MSSLSMSKCPETFVPLIYCIINHARHSICCFSSSTSGTFVWQSHCCISPQILQSSTSDLECWGHRSGEMKASVSHPRRLSCARARYSGAVSCRKIKNLPEMSHMTEQLLSQQHIMTAFVINLNPIYDEYDEYQLHFPEL